MNRYLLIFVLAFSSLFGLYAQEKEAQLSLQYNQKIEYKREVYEQTLETIRNNPDTEELDQLYFNLAELSTEIDQSDPAKIASYFQQVLRYNRNFIYKDIVLYNLAYFLEEAVKLEYGKKRQLYLAAGEAVPDSLKFSEELFSKAIFNYKRVQQEHPLSSYYDESTWRLAELYLNIAQANNGSMSILRKALSNFELIIDKRDSPFYFHSALGSAWTLFEMADHDSAFSVCKNILNEIDEAQYVRDYQTITSDVVELVSWILAANSRIDFNSSNIAAAQIEIRLRNLKNENWKKKIIFAVGKQLLKLDKPLSAVDFFKAYLALYPETANAPELDDAIIDVYRQYPSLFGGEQTVRELIAERHTEMLQIYASDSKWYQENKDKDIYSSVAVIRTLIEFKEPELFNKFLDLPLNSNYINYLVLVNDYIGFSDFPSPISNQKEKEFMRNLVYMSQILAQSTELPQDYELAINALQDFNSTYPYNSEYLDFVMNIFFCYEKLYNLQTNEPAAYTTIDSLYIQSSEQYERMLREDENWENQQNKLAKVIFKRAEYYLNNSQYDAALQDFQAVTELQAEEELITDSWRRSAEIALQQKDFAAAENYFRQASIYAEGINQTIIFDNILAVIEEKARYLLSQNQPDKAAAEFLRLSAELEGVYPEKSLRFYSQAIDIYEELGNDKKVNELLKSGSQKKNLNQVIAIYNDTWKEADKLKDWQRSIALRNDFIRMYPGSNEAFRVMLQIIDIYENKLNEKEKAARMFLELHASANTYDLGSQRVENLFLNALRIYQNLDNKQKCIQLTNQFFQKYPDYSLIDLNLKYNDSDNFGTIIRKLQKLKDNINVLFASEEYLAMADKIRNFQEISTALNADSLQVDLARENARFDIYLEFAEFYLKFDNQLNYIENNFLMKSPRELIPVSNSTRWQENLVGGEDLIGKLMFDCDQTRNSLLVLLQEGQSFQLEMPDYTHAVWAIAACYDHAYQAVDQQIRNYVVKSDQLNNEELTQNKFLQSELKRRVIAEGDDHAFKFKLAAAGFYQNLLYNYYDKLDYSDLWTRKSLTRLKEWGIRSSSGEIVALDEKMLLAEESYADEEIENEYNQIYAEYQAKNYPDAYTRFMNFVKAYTGHKLSYYALYYAGESYYNMGQLSQAADIFEKILDFERDKTPDALMRLGHYYNSKGETEQAYYYWNRLVEEYPDHYLAQIIKLSLDQIKQQEKLSAPLTEREISEDRKIILTYRKYMQNYQKGKYKAAQRGFAKFNKKYPEHELAYNSLFMQAEAWYKLLDYSEALAIYDQVASLPGNKSALAAYRAGLCAQELGNNSLRDEYWLNLIENHPHHYLVNVITSENKALATQISHLKPQHQTKPVNKKEIIIPEETDKAQLTYKKALMEFRYQNYAQAIEIFNEFLEEFPQHRLVYNARFLKAEALQNSGSYAESAAIFEQLLPLSGNRRPDILLHIAQNKIALGNYNEARDVLQQVLHKYAGTFSAAQAKLLLKEIPRQVNDE